MEVQVEGMPVDKELSYRDFIRWSQRIIEDKWELLGRNRLKYVMIVVYSASKVHTKDIFAHSGRKIHPPCQHTRMNQSFPTSILRPRKDVSLS